MREVKIATERSLQRGEFSQFMDFAKKQEQLEEIRAFSFYGKTGAVELSSDAERVGQTLPEALWEQTRNAEDIVTVEEDSRLSLFYPLRVDADMRRLQPDSSVGELYGLLHLEFSKEGIHSMLAAAQNAHQASRRRVVAYLAIFVCLAAAAVAAVAVFVSRWLVRPLKSVTDGLEAITQGQWDLTKRFEGSDRGDETGALARGVNTLLEKLQHIIHDVREHVSVLSRASAELSSTAGNMTEEATHMSGQSSTAATPAEQLAATVKDMTASTHEMSTNVDSVVAAVGEITSSIDVIAQNADQAAGVADNATQLANVSDQKIGQLRTAADEIGAVTNTIQDIAEQTNLLALNATIEAARAGDAGRGFAVVATEVKELARQTADATDDIRQRIESIQSSTGEAVDSIGAISNVIQELTDVSKTIAEAVEEQSVTTKDIAHNVSQSSGAAQSVTAKVASSAESIHDIGRTIEEVDAAAKKTADGASQTKTAGGELSTLATELQSLVDQFKV